MHFVTALHRIAKAPGGPEIFGEVGLLSLVTELKDIFEEGSVDEDTRHLSNTAWALAVLPVKDGPLRAAISAQSLPLIRSFDPQNMSNTAWALSTCEMFDLPLFDATASQALPRIRHFGM